MSQDLLYKKYYGDDVNDIQRDIEESILEIDPNEINENGKYKGYVRIRVEYIPEGGCECVGFQHDTDCPNWVMSY